MSPPFHLLPFCRLANLSSLLLLLLAPLTSLAQYDTPLAEFTNCPPGATWHASWAVAALGNDRVLIGGPEGPTGTNVVYQYGTNGALLGTWYAPAAAWGQEFGMPLASLGGDRVLVGAQVWVWMDPNDPSQTPPPGAWLPGAAYLFNTNGFLVTILDHPNPTPGNWDGFGAAVAPLGDDRVLIGVPNWDIWMPGHGSAYLLRDDGAVLATFTSPSPFTGDDFGSTLTAVGTDHVLISAQGAGAVFLFNTNGTLITTFWPPHPAAGSQEGFGVALAAVGSDRVLIGAPSYDTAWPGAAYLFSTNGTLLATFTNPSHPVADIGDDFGSPLVAVGTDRVLIGAPWSSAVFLFDTNATLQVTYTDPWTTYRQRFGSLLATAGTARVVIGSAYGGPVYLFGMPSPVFWLGGPGYWSDPTQWWPNPPTADDAVVLKAGAMVYVEVPNAQAGALTLEPGSTLEVEPGAALTVYGALVNNGTMILSGDMTSYAAGDAVIQNGSLTISNGVAMKGFDGGGSDFAFVQTGGATTVDGTLDFGHGHIHVQGGNLNVDKAGAMKGFDGGGRDLAFVQTGGNVTIDGTVQTWNPSVQNGSFSIGTHGNVALGNGSSFFETGGTVSIDGTLALGTLAPGGSGVVINDGRFTVGASGTVSGSSSGGGIGLAQSGGTVVVNGTLAMRGFDSGGHDVAYAETGGMLNGSGTINGSLVASAGVISPGSSPGTLTITSNFVQGVSNTLRIEIAGRQPGQFDQLRVAGRTTLAGQADVRLLDSFAPDLGEQFPFLISTNVVGAFTNVFAPPGITVSCTTTGVVPVVTGIVPTQILGPVLNGSTAVMTFGTVTNRSYTVEWTAGLGSMNWLFYTNLIGTGAKMHVAVPVTGVGQHFFRVSQP